MKRKILSIDEFVNEELAFESQLASIEPLNEAEGLRDTYKKYFSDTLAKFDVSSLGELPREKRGEFFNKLKEGWEKGVGHKMNEKDRADLNYKNAKLIISEMNEKIARLSKDLDEAKDDDKAHRNGLIEECKKKLKEAQEVVKNYKGHLSLQESEQSEIDKQRIYYIAVTTKGEHVVKHASWNANKSTTGSLRFKTEAEAQDKADKLNAGVKESVNEGADIKSDAEFKSWAEEKLKKMHGDKYDAKIAGDTIDGLLKKKKDDGLDYGAIIGMLNK